MESLESSYTESGPIENVIQGDLWREVIKPKFAGKTVLPLGFNFDDYETAGNLEPTPGFTNSVQAIFKFSAFPRLLDPLSKIFF